jgi:hypothetical protein
MAGLDIDHLEANSGRVASCLDVGINELFDICITDDTGSVISRNIVPSDKQRMVVSDPG